MFSRYDLSFCRSSVAAMKFASIANGVVLALRKSSDVAIIFLILIVGIIQVVCFFTLTYISLILSKLQVYFHMTNHNYYF